MFFQLELASEDNVVLKSGKSRWSRVSPKNQELVEACRNTERMTAETFLHTILGVLSHLLYSTAEEIENKRSLLICLFVCFLYVIFLVIQKVRS